jgi:hypothetical protein
MRRAESRREAAWIINEVGRRATACVVWDPPLRGSVPVEFRSGDDRSEGQRARSGVRIPRLLGAVEGAR